VERTYNWIMIIHVGLTRSERAAPRLCMAAKHHCVTRVRPWKSDGMSLPAFWAIWSPTAADSATTILGCASSTRTAQQYQRGGPPVSHASAFRSSASGRSYRATTGRTRPGAVIGRAENRTFNALDQLNGCHLLC